MSWTFWWEKRRGGWWWWCEYEDEEEDREEDDEGWRWRVCVGRVEEVEDVLEEVVDIEAREARFWEGEGGMVSVCVVFGPWLGFVLP